MQRLVRQVDYGGGVSYPELTKESIIPIGHSNAQPLTSTVYCPNTGTASTSHKSVNQWGRHRDSVSLRCEPQLSVAVPIPYLSTLKNRPLDRGTIHRANGLFSKERYR